MRLKDFRYKLPLKRRKLIAVAALIFVTFLGSLMVALWHNERNVRYSLKAVPNVDELVLYGDMAFRDYQYNQAYNTYQRAENRLSALMEFENNSPSKNADLLQHYHNKKILLRARKELTLIAANVSRGKNQAPKR